MNKDKEHALWLVQALEQLKDPKGLMRRAGCRCFATDSSEVSYTAGSVVIGARILCQTCRKHALVSGTLGKAGIVNPEITLPASCEDQ